MDAFPAWFKPTSIRAIAKHTAAVAVAALVVVT